MDFLGIATVAQAPSQPGFSSAIATLGLLKASGISVAKDQKKSFGRLDEKSRSCG